jgi:D-alanyl-D-alanine carboxypeptidase
VSSSARIAVREPDGTVTAVGAGTPTLDPASGPVDPDVPWNIGSATKVFVAVVVLQLAEEGLIDLDAGLGGSRSWLPAADGITPRQLLNHTSGLGEYLDQPAVVADARRAWTPAELIGVAEAAGRVGEPGGAHLYSNTNYIVLGELIAAVTGRSWADEVHARTPRRSG